MILSDGQILDSLKFNALVQDQATRYAQSLPLTYLNRTKRVNADDDEIIGTFTGTVYAADVIADDSKAAVYDAGVFELVTNALPNIKIGKRFSQQMIARLNRLKRNLASGADVAAIRNWEVQTGLDLNRGIDETENALICGCLLDAVTYDRYGIKITGTWGMPSDLKSTPSTLWTNPAATPITDILTLKQYAANTYGETYDKLTMPLADFQNAVNTTEFKQLISGLIGNNIGTTAFNSRSPRMRGFFMDLIEMDVEFEDKTYIRANMNGSKATTRVHPLGKVLMSSKADEGNSLGWDFGNAIVTESTVASLVGMPQAGGEQYGPFAYFEGELNPPNLLAWGVARGFPRKHRKTCTAVLTVQ